MIPWEKLDKENTAAGAELALFRRGEEYVIRINGHDLMGSRLHDSEEELATRGCAECATKANARVLVGGLGLGFTLRAALNTLMPTAEVHVAELVPAVVRWNRDVLAHLAGRPLEDPRVTVIEGDVVQTIATAKNSYDAIMLDVDNGPDAFTIDTNASMYGRKGIARIATALRPRGVFSLWSVGGDPKFTERLKQGGFTAKAVQVPARKGTGMRHTLWIAQKN